MRDTVRFRLDGVLHEVRNPDPTLTVLRYLRETLTRSGTKEGCAEGDCGACTVVVAEQAHGAAVFRAVNSCILFLPMIDGKTLYTVESLSGPHDALHPVQQAMVDCNASQCGFCTPGFVMSLYAHYRNGADTNEGAICDALAGNLCRCTGYGPIVSAAKKMGEYRQIEEVSPAPLDTDGMLALTYVDPHTGAVRKFFAPQTIVQLGELSEMYPDAVYLAGATDVGLWVTKRLRVLDTIISVASVAELRVLSETKDTVEIGAGVRYSEAYQALERLHPDLGELLRRLGSVQVRNAGTIGGNIANGSPIADSVPPLVALGATLGLRKGAAQRMLPLEDFFLAYGKQDRQPGEFVEKVIVPKLGAQDVFRVYKLSKRFDQDISAVCGAIKFTPDRGIARGVRIAFGGMAATPKRAKAAEAALEGRPWNEAGVRAAMAALEKDFAPIADMRASARYRMEAAKNLLLRAYRETNGESARVLAEQAMAYE
ncbi:MAG: xanthine dehydrogenase small subunit [Alphaproteobacteria bacterium]|nr:xanthine dehydrogenase small subunit [Alphaproteobacteria bacterium]MDE2630509.1 xanthine dehydrogenase small subunit [Alphaproteobacteria bacterium]